MNKKTQNPKPTKKPPKTIHAKEQWRVGETQKPNQSIWGVTLEP